MRNLLMALLLINVLAWAYQKWILEPDNPVSALHIQQDYPRLSLVASPVAKAPVAAPETAELGEKAAKCIKIGPIIGEKDAKSIASRLGSRGITVRQSALPGQVWVGHWVQVVGLSDRQAAETERNRLIANGLSDAYIVSGGAAPKISLGVFRSARSAESTVAVARSLQLQTVIEERYQPGIQHWLEVQLTDGRQLQAGELRSEAGQILRTETVPCNAAKG